MDPAKAAKVAATVESIVKPELADSNLTMSLWGIDSLVISPIAIDIDDNGDLYYVTTNRQKNSEFDIRSHHFFYQARKIVGRFPPQFCFCFGRISY